MREHRGLSPSDRLQPPAYIPELNDEQKAALLALANNPTDTSLIQEYVVLLTDEGTFENTVDALDNQVPGSGTDGVSRNLLLSSYATYQVFKATIDEVSGFEGHQDLTVHTMNAVIERCAAQTIINSPKLWQLPIAQIRSEIIKTQMLAYDSKTPEEYKLFSELFLGFVTRYTELQQNLKDVNLVQHKEARRSAELASETDGLFTAVRELASYRVVPVYVRDDTALPIKDWHVFTFEHEVRELLGEDALEETKGSPREDTVLTLDGFTSHLANQPAGGVDLESFGQIHSMSYEGLIEGRPQQMQSDIRIYLHKEGELVGLNGMPLKWFCDSLGLETQYELYRARAVSMYADMTLPSYIVDNDEGIQQANVQLLKNSERVRSANFREMVLARTRVIKSNPNLAEEIEEIHRRQRRKPAKHRVGGFVRPIPKTQRASARQRELCRKYMKGRELAEFGETYVHDHERGGNEDGVEIRGHRGKIRYLGGTLVQNTAETPDPNAKP